MADENVYTRCVVVKGRDGPKDPLSLVCFSPSFPFPCLPSPALVVKTIAQFGWNNSGIMSGYRFLRCGPTQTSLEHS